MYLFLCMLQRDQEKRGICICVHVCVLNYGEVNVQPTIDFGKGSR